MKGLLSEVTDLDDKKIIEQFFNRDEQALCAVKERFGRAIFSLAHSLLKNAQDAEEALSDTLLALWNCIPPNKPEQLLGFTLKIARNLSLKKLREKRAARRGGGELTSALFELEECITDGKTIDEALENCALSEIIDSFLRGLEKDERNIFILRYFYLCSVSDIAARFNFSKSKVKTQLFRTRQKLSIKLEKEGVVL